MGEGRNNFFNNYFALVANQLHAFQSRLASNWAFGILKMAKTLFTLDFEPILNLEKPKPNPWY